LYTNETAGIHLVPFLVVVIPVKQLLLLAIQHVLPARAPEAVERIAERRVHAIISIPQLGVEVVVVNGIINVT
jgi:hypothetical protein